MLLFFAEHMYLLCYTYTAYANRGINALAQLVKGTTSFYIHLTV